LESSPGHYKALFNRLLEGKLSDEELEDLVKWIGDEKLDGEAAELIGNQLSRPVPSEKIDPVLVSHLGKRLDVILDSKAHHPGMYVRARMWFRYAAVFIIVSSLAVFYFKSSNPKTTGVTAQVENSVMQHDIAPGSAGAILTLADGTRLVLDSIANGKVATQNGPTVSLQNGELRYNGDGSNGGSIVYNTVTTPKGRQFQTTLADGTRVWLNAGSSLRFPTAFTGKERRVEITGEGYFEVAKQAAKPFIVSTDHATEIVVLGTHFNINSYENEASIKTTLLEGSVNVRTQSGNRNAQVIIRPGQQAQLADGKFKINTDIDVGKVMAWKNGVFNFNDAKLEEVMRQLERWYNIEVVYEKGIPELEFMGKMGRDLSLAKVLRGLEMSEVHFRLEERRLIVMP